MMKQDRFLDGSIEAEVAGDLGTPLGMGMEQLDGGCHLGWGDLQRQLAWRLAGRGAEQPLFCDLFKVADFWRDRRRAGASF